jgi:hypothetical protein
MQKTRVPVSDFFAGLLPVFAAQTPWRRPGVGAGRGKAGRQGSAVKIYV